jgi:AraC-like DNA-binding protein
MPLDADDFTEYRFSTDDLPERDRISAWREHFARTLLGVDFEPLPEASLHADMRLCALPGLPIASGSVSAARYERTPERIADGNDDLYLVAVKGSPCTVSQRGREMALGDGDAVLISGSDVSTFISFKTMHFLNLCIPFAALAPLASDLDDAVARPIPRDTEALRLLIGYLGVLRENRALTAPDLHHSVTTHVHDLAALAIGATREAAAMAGGRGLRAARLHALKADIVKILGHRDLSIGAVAARHGITVRYLHKLFENEGKTFSEFVLSQRLARAHRLLTDPRCAGHPISAIAYQAGFGDLSYFNRSFRRCYGVTPSDIREQARP